MTVVSSASRTLDASPQVVYGVLADYVRHHPNILPKPQFESLAVEAGGVGEGTALLVTMPVMGRRHASRGPSTRRSSRTSPST